ncbi:MAG: DNA internalization-related competence protein ComEC/Rec2, partial [Acidobacteria bacterium]|nr:DNA internalization-related competence protein ComEC/Rec2 [Acidobacteriota bacterium]
ALAALVVLLLRPGWLFDSGFQLSFAAVLLIALLAVPWMERTSLPYRQALQALDDPERDDHFAPRQAQFRLDLRDLASRLGRFRRLLFWMVRAGFNAWNVLVISFAVHLGFVLLLALYFHRVTWTGLVANVVVVPLVGFMVPLGLALLLLGTVWLAAAKFVAPAVATLTDVLLWVVTRLGTLDWLTWRIPAPPSAVVLAYGIALVLLALSIRRRRRWQLLVAVPVAVLVAVIVTYPFAPKLTPGELEVTVLDVGQGDAIVLALPQGESWLVDAGPGAIRLPEGYWLGQDTGENVVSPYLWSRGLKQLDRAILTHAHHDHLGGFPAVLDNFRVGEFWVGNNPETPAYRRLLEKAREHKIVISQHGRGEVHELGGARIEILSPPLDQPPDPQSPNNDSLVVRVSYRGQRVLLAGDIERSLEVGLLAAGLPLAADALKVPHHGSRTSASTEFLSAVGASTAVISVGGQNPHGHPHPEVLARLTAASAATFRTDRDGAVTVRTNGRTIGVSSFAREQRRTPYANLGQRLRALWP